MADDPPIDPSQPRAASPEIHRTETASDRTVDVEHPTTVLDEKAEDLPPDGGYGWVCVACNFCINAHTWGINSTYGVFLGYYLSHNYFPNTSALAYAFIGGLSISQAVMIAPLATHIIHLFGTKVCLHVGIFLETVGLLGASFSTQKYQIILAQGLCFGWGMGFLFTGSVGGKFLPDSCRLKLNLLRHVPAPGGSGFPQVLPVKVLTRSQSFRNGF